MHTFDPAPDAAIAPNGTPRFGSYVGSVPRIDLSRVTGSSLRRIARRKRWMYVAIASEQAFVAMAIVRLGYAATAFAYALDPRTMRMVATRSTLAPPTACRVSDRAGPGCVASFRFGGSHARITRAERSPSYIVEAELQGLRLNAVLDTTDAPPAITAIAPIGGDRDRLVNTTEKRALLSATGELEVDGRRRPLANALAGYDYTHGLLARRTAWRWAFALGRARSGERVGLNLVQGFVGPPECAVWVDREVFPLEEGRFAFDRSRPMSEWRVSTADGAVDLRFTPGGMHSEEKNLGVIASRFVQPSGTYAGTVRVAGRVLELKDVLGVTEDQEVLW